MRKVSVSSLDLGPNAIIGKLPPMDSEVLKKLRENAMEINREIKRSKHRVGCLCSDCTARY